MNLLIEKPKQELHKNVTSYLEQILEATYNETTDVRPLIFHLKNSPSKMNKRCWILLENQELTHDFLFEPLHIEMPVLAN